MPVNGFISWDIKNDCYSYNIQISKDIDFSDLVVDSMKILDKKFIYDLEPNTIYYCRVKTYNDNNKSQWSDVVKFKTESTTSVIINDDNKELEIFPNPVIDILNIQSNYFDNTDAVIYDLMGNIVLSTKFNYQINKIDVSNLNRGVYIILINNQKGLFIKQ